MALLSAAAFASNKCAEGELSRDSFYLSALDSLRFLWLWRDSGNSTPDKHEQFLVGTGPGLRVLCFERLNECYVFGTDKEPSDVRLVGATAFSESVEAGRLELKVLGSRSVTRVQELPGVVPTLANGIDDPLKGHPTNTESRITVLSFERPCITNMSAFGGAIPEGVRSKKRPKLAERVIAAVQNQGLTALGATVVIPYFVDGDTTFGIEVRSLTGTITFLTIHVAGEWIRFNPLVPKNVKQFADKIWSVRMVEVNSRAAKWLR